MDKLPVGQLPDLQQSNNDDEIMVITNSEYSQLKKEKISDLITDFTSTNENNALTKGTDGKMFVTDFGNASNITEGKLPVSVLPDIPKDLLPEIETADLPVSGVSADTYAYPSSVTVNAQGQVTAIEEGTPSGANANTDLSNITEAGKEVIRENSGSGFNMFDLVTKDYVLSFEESKGFAQLGTYVYKEAVPGSRYGYPDFYNKCIEEYTEAEIQTKTFEQPILTSNGTMGGNSFAVAGSSYYANSDTYNAWRAFNGVTDVQTDIWACENNSESAYFDFYNPKPIKVKTLTILNRYSGTVGAITAGSVQGSNNGSTWETIKSFTNDIVTANTSWEIDLTTNTKFYRYYRINCTAFTGTYCCINQLYIDADESLNYFPAKVSTNGHKFYDIADKAIVDSLFEELGEAWYYGIDTVNQRICLPRTTRFQYSTNTDNIGTYQEAGLPNIEGCFWGNRISYEDQAYAEGCFTQEKSNGEAASNVQSAKGVKFNFDASLSNSIYGNSDKVTPSATNMLLYMVVGNTDVESAIIDIVDVTTTENDTIPLFTGVYFDFKPNHPSWLKAGAQQNSGGIYATCYNELVKALEGTNPYNLKVIDVDEMQADTDYSEYWKVNQTSMTFETPTKLSYKALTGRVKGNGKSFVYTNGTTEYGVGLYNASNHFLGLKDGVVGENVGTSGTNVTSTAGYNSLGITTDPANSGIVAEESTSQLYFKVANAVENLELLNVGEITESLVNKVDYADTEFIARQALPSDKYEDLSFVTSGNNYTAVSDGYFTFEVIGNAGSWVLAYNTVTKLSSSTVSAGTNGYFNVFMPVKKGDICKISFWGTMNRARFIYAQGASND